MSSQVSANVSFTGSITAQALYGVSNTAAAAYVPQDFSSSGLNIPAYVVSNTATVANTVAYSSFGPFAGEGSLQFPGGTGSYVNFGLNSPLAFNWWTNVWTIETWVNFASFSGTAIVFGNASGSADYYSLSVSSTSVFWYYYNGSGQTVSGPSAITTNSWNHIAVSFDGTNVRVFVNGVSGTSTTVSGTPQSSSSVPMQIGATFSGTMNAYLSNLRIVRGLALYTTTFQVPTQPLTAIQGTTQAGLPYGTVLLLRNAPAPGRIQTTRLTGSNSGSVLSFPPAAMTGYATALSSGYGQGTYVASASSELVGGAAWQSFDKVTGTAWTSGSNYSSSAPYQYIGSAATTTIDVNGTSYSGDWCQIQMPASIVLSNYTVTSGANYNTQTAAKWWILGSRDGIIWNLVDSRSGVTSTSSYQVMPFTVSASQAFNYYRMVINQLQGYLTGYTNTNVPEWTLNGQIEGLNINPDGKIGIGLANPTRALEVAGDVVCGGTLSAGNPLMFRNALYNGDFRIAQRGTSFPGGGGYLLDRWKISSYGAGGAYYTVSQIQSGLANFSNALQLQQTSTNSMFFFLQQSLETRDVVRFQGQPVTVSFWYKIPTSFTGSINAQLNWSTAVDTPLTDIGISYTTAGSLTLTNQTAWTYATFTTFVPLTAQALSVMFTNYPPGGSTVNGATIQITGVQLEKGLVATPFEVRPYATELALCQRYWEQSYALGTAAGTNTNVGLVQLYGSSDSGGNMVATQRYQVAKRITVTPTIYTTSGTAGSWTYVRSGATGTGTLNDNSFSAVFGYNFYITVGAAWVPCYIQGHWVANAEL